MTRTSLNKLKLILVLGLVGLNSCQDSYQEETVKYRIESVFRQRPQSVIEEITPKYYAVLENGDTVPVNMNSRAGDSVTYIYRRYP